MRALVFLLCILFQYSLGAQGLKGVVVETYYITDSNDSSKGEGVTEGLVSYRIFVELEEGYTLQAVYGSPEHPLQIETTTSFYNSELGASLGEDLKRHEMQHGTQLLDSYVTIGAACMDRLGLPKQSDTDGSTLAQKKKNGLCNSADKIDISLKKSDGFCHGKSQSITTFGLDLKALEFEGESSAISAKNGAWAALGGFAPVSTGGQVLIAQLTTDGQLTFQLNLQLGTPDGNSIRYVATDPETNELQFDALRYSLKDTGQD